FFQAEDGIRDRNVTGVQTCALPISRLGVGTAVVLVLCVATLVVCRRWLRQVPGQGGGSVRMALVETLPLGNRCLIHLVRVGKQQIGRASCRERGEDAEGDGAVKISG